MRRQEDLPEMGPRSGAPHAPDRAHTRRQQRWQRGAEALVAVALVAIAVVVRRSSLPDDGLIYDDAWVATGATKGTLGDLLHVSTNHPGFSAMLMACSRVVSGRSELLATPSFVIGAATPAIAYLVLRRLRVGWPASLFAAALLLVAPPHVQYSGRVKSYVFEAVAVLLLAVVVGPLARRTWNWRVAAAWVAAAVAIGTFSIFCLVAVASAGVILALHPSNDRRRRLVAVGVQGAIQVVYLRVVQASFDSSQLTTDWSEVYDGYLDLHANPSVMAREVASHLRRVGQALLDVGSVPALVIVVLAVVGLAVAARRGDRKIAARYLLALLGIALVGSVARVVPLGPSVGNPVFPGGRATVWLLPSLVVGLAFALDAGMRWLADNRVRSVPMWPVQVAVALAAVAVVAPLIDHRTPYPIAGARSGHEFVERYAGPDDVIVLFPAGDWTYSAEPRVRVAIHPTPQTLNGFVPRQLDDRVWSLSSDPWDGTVRQVRLRVRGAPQVLLHDGFIGLGDANLAALEKSLRFLGYRPGPSVFRGALAVSVWQKPPG